MDTRVGFGAISVLADEVEECIRKSVDARGVYIGNPEVIKNYLELRKYLEGGKND